MKKELKAEIQKMIANARTSHDIDKHGTERLWTPESMKQFT